MNAQLFATFKRSRAQRSRDARKHLLLLNNSIAILREAIDICKRSKDLLEATRELEFKTAQLIASSQHKDER